MQPIKVLHIIDWLCAGGAARSGIAISKYSSRISNFKHSIASLKPPDPYTISLAQQAGMRVQTASDRSTIEREIVDADIVHVHFWNHPRMYEFLRSDLPPMRLLIWFHVAGDFPPQVITKELVDFADLAIPCNPYSAELPVFKQLSGEVRSKKVGMVYDAADFDRVAGIQPKPHDTFNVGYLGHLTFAKMHPNYIPMSSAVEIPSVRFILCGTGSVDYLKQQAQQLGTANRFEFRGYIENIKSAIELFDVYGYPLCEDTYAAAELNLQEVMYAGIPPIVFPHGGIKRLIINNYTGLVVNSELEYKQAIEYLYHHPEERARLGRNAKEYAQQIFGAENAAKALNPIYERLMQQPKRHRSWGIPAGSSLLDRPVSLEDFTQEYTSQSGAKLFIQSLGETAPQFTISLTSDNIQEKLNAEQQIFQSSPLVYGGEGGLFQYQDYYPNDGYLKLWSGLVWQALGDNNRAISLFSQAIELGCNSWRVSWYLACSAERTQNFSLAQKLAQAVIKAVPNFPQAQEMMKRLPQPSALAAIQPPKPEIILSQIHQYQKNPSDSANLTALRQSRLQLARYWVSLSSDTLGQTCTGELAKAHQDLWILGPKNERLTHEETQFSQQLVAKVTRGFDFPDTIPALLASTLYFYPHQLDIAYQNAPIPDWFASGYMTFMFESPRLFKDIGEVDRYHNFLSGWVGYLHENIQRQPNDSVWQQVTRVFSRIANLTPAYFSHLNQLELQKKRAEILERYLSQQGCQLDYTFPDRSRSKIRIGLLCQHFDPSAETFTILPVFEHLDRDRFEVYLYALNSSDGLSQQYCRSRADRFTQLPHAGLHPMVEAIRGDDLDILLIGSNITAILGQYAFPLLSVHRLARTQAIALSSPVTTGMGNIDYYIAGTLTIPPSNPQEYYTEKLVTVEGSGLCFRYPEESAVATINPTRDDLGATSETIIFISGANFRKINPELRHTWVKVLAATPNSILILYPFGPNWGRHPQLEQPFEQQMQAVFAQYGIDAKRLVILHTLPSHADIPKYLELADVYLDSYLYSGAASALDALRINLPLVVMEGEELRARQSSALLRELQIPDLIARNEDEYIRLAVSLGTHPQLRQQKRQQIQQQMQQSPPFLDSRAYGKKMAALFDRMVDGTVEPLETHRHGEPISESPSPQVSQPDVNRLLGCVNLYEIDPSNTSIVSELSQLRRQLAEYFLNLPTSQLETVYRGELGFAYQTFLKSGFAQEPVPESDRPFLQQLTQQSAGFTHPGAFNAFLGVMLYYAPGTMKVQDPQTRLPGWLIEDYQAVFEAQTLTSPSPQPPQPPVSAAVPHGLSTEFLNRLLGCANLYEIDPSEPSVICELHQLRRQLAEYWLSLPIEGLESLYRTEVGQRYQVLLKSGFAREPLNEGDRAFLQQLSQMAAGSTHPQWQNALLGAMLYYEPGKMKVQDWQTRLPGWLIEDYKAVFETV